MGFEVNFWGVRGSIACPSPSHVEFGGNTSCVEVRCGETRMIFDAGTGIRNLGHRLMHERVKRATLLMSHTHWDHINGFPFFAPAFHAENSFHVMAGHLYDREGIRSVLAGQMTSPMFPVPLEAMRAELTFEDFAAGDEFALPADPEVRLRTARLNHPGGATGYRIEYGGRSVCYVTDTEHIIGEPDRNILDLIEGADVVIYDSTYTDNEFPEKVGWGHSTWQEGVRLCRDADVGKLAIFHHDPDHEDKQMRKIERDARKAWKEAFAARENMRIRLA